MTISPLCEYADNHELCRFTLLEWNRLTAEYYETPCQCPCHQRVA